MFGKRFEAGNFGRFDLWRIQTTLSRDYLYRHLYRLPKMRKRLTPAASVPPTSPEADWLGMESSAQAEVTSEEDGHPIESVLGISAGPGWRASEPGTQHIRLLFDHPVSLRRIHLEFREEQRERVQEFVLSWSADAGQTYREIVRQQYVFSSAATREVEDYRVALDHVTALELQIIPDLSRSDARASLHRLQIA